MGLKRTAAGEPVAGMLGSWRRILTSPLRLGELLAGEDDAQKCFAPVQLIAQAGIHVDVDRRIAVDEIAASVALAQPHFLVGAQRFGVAGADDGLRLA